MPIFRCRCWRGECGAATLRTPEYSFFREKHPANYTIIPLFGILLSPALYGRLHYVYMLEALSFRLPSCWPTRARLGGRSMENRRLRVKRTTLGLLLALTALLVLALTACVRPAPGFENQPPATATTGLLVNPTLPLATLPSSVITTPGVLPDAASPTPLPPVLDGSVPVEASPTPLPPAPEPTQPPPADSTAPTGEIIHIVAPGDNLFRIGLRYGFTAEQLAAYNGIPNVNLINVGQQIRIPPTTPTP